MAEICIGMGFGSITTMAVIMKVTVAPYSEMVKISEDYDLEPANEQIERDIEKSIKIRRRVCLFAG